MYLVDALRVLLRQWRIVLGGVLALGMAAAGVVQWVPTQYQASGQMILLLPSEATGTDTPTNPYLNLEPGLTVAATLVASSVVSKDTRRAVEEAGYTATYDAGIDPGTGPLIQVTTQDDDPVEAVDTRDVIIDLLEKELKRIQDDVQAPERQMMAAKPANVGSRAEALPGSKAKAMALIGAVIIFVTLVAAFAWDRRRRRPTGPAARGTAS